MELAEYRKRLQAALTNPDQLPLMVSEIDNALVEDTTRLGVLSEQTAKDRQRIDDLQAIANRMYLNSVTGKPSAQDDLGAPKTDALDTILKEAYNIGS